MSTRQQPIIQTTLFQQARTEESDQVNCFINPIQFAVAEAFPIDIDLIILSAVFNANREQLGCTHVIEFDGLELMRYEHPPVSIPYQDAGVAFRLNLEQVSVANPGTLVVKTTLSDGTQGQMIPLRVAAKSELQASL